MPHAKMTNAIVQFHLGVTHTHGRLMLFARIIISPGLQFASAFNLGVLDERLLCFKIEISYKIKTLLKLI